jgi:hypothetical protein
MQDPTSGHVTLCNRSSTLSTLLTRLWQCYQQPRDEGSKVSNEGVRIVNSEGNTFSALLLIVSPFDFVLYAGKAHERCG